MADHQDRKAELIRELERARAQARSFRQSPQGAGATVSARAGASVSRHRYGWMLGAILTGFIIARLARGRGKAPARHLRATKGGSLETAGKAGFALAAFKILFDITKPVLIAWATKRLGEAVGPGKPMRYGFDKAGRRPT